MLVLGLPLEAIDSEFEAIYETLGISDDPLTLAAYAQYHHLRFLQAPNQLSGTNRSANS